MMFNRNVRQDYKLSRYTCWTPLSEDLHILHSTLYKSTAVVTRAIFELLSQPKGVDLDTFDGEARQQLEKLVAQGLLVPSEHDETYYVRYLIDSAKFDYSAMEIAILTTMACNFRCRYCTELGFHNEVWLNATVVDALVGYFERIFKAKHPRKFRLVYYGGEPLLNVESIRICSAAFTELTGRFGCQLEQYVITNGFLLDNSTVQSLKESGIQDYQITLDGPEKIHDERRPLHSGQPTWSRIMENIVRFLEGNNRGTVSIRINVDAHNASTVPELLDILVANGIARSDRVLVYPAPVVPAFNPEDDWNQFVLKRAAKADVFVTLWKEMYERQIPVAVFPDYYPCGLRVDWASVIYPNGTLYTCTGFIGYDAYAKGSVYSDETSYTHLRMVEEEIERACLQCRWMPFCGGGCKYIATCMCVPRWCEKAFYERAYPVFIKLKTIQKIHGSGKGIPIPACF